MNCKRSAYGKIVFSDSSQHKVGEEHRRSKESKDDGFLFVALLRDCSKNKDLQRGIKVHGDIARNGLLEKCVDALVTMYAKCGELDEAKRLFDMHSSKDVITWTALIAGYAQKEQGQEALKYYEQMQSKGLTPDAVTYSCILKACSSIRAINKGQKIHLAVMKQGFPGHNIILGNALVNMYAKCGAPSKAHGVLLELPYRDAFSWSALIEGYTAQGEGEEALECFQQMLNEGCFPDPVTYTCILKACGSIRAAEKGAKIHNEITKQGLLTNNNVLGNALVSMYAKCGDFGKACGILEELPVRNVITWTALIIGHTDYGEGEQALNCFEVMQVEGVSPNAVTYACILKACGSLGAVDNGEKICDVVAEQGLLDNNIVLGNAIIDMYAKCGALSNAQRVLEELPFRNIISWNTLITGYVEHGEDEQALTCFERMKGEGLSPNAATYACILSACGRIRAASNGEEIHNEIVEQGLLQSDVVLGTALVNMYAKCGALTKGRRVLEELPSADNVAWTVLIAGYIEHGATEEALNCCELMQREGHSPNPATLVSILKACSSIGALDKGQKLHQEISKQGLLGSNLLLGTALVYMYAKCGVTARAHQVFNELPSRDAISWTTLLTGYVNHGKTEEALNCFEQMQHEGLSPNAATLSCVLSACSCLGLLEDAQMCFVRSRKFGLKPELEHYTCMIDLYARAGHLHKAVGVMEDLPTSDRAVWLALLGACGKWGNVDIGTWAFEQNLNKVMRDCVPVSQ